MCDSPQACGPFQEYAYGYAALNAYFATFSVLDVVYVLLTQSAMALWVLLIGVAMAFFFRRNSLNVVRVSDHEAFALMDDNLQKTHID